MDLKPEELAALIISRMKQITKDFYNDRYSDQWDNPKNDREKQSHDKAQRRNAVIENKQIDASNWLKQTANEADEWLKRLRSHTPYE